MSKPYSWRRTATVRRIIWTLKMVADVSSETVTWTNNIKWHQSL
jgi:putative exporter of polyketide antibiotics